MKLHAAAVLLCCFASIAQAAMSSANFNVPTQVIASGGNAKASANFAITDTAGQGTIGPSTSANFSNGAGFWNTLTSIIVFSFTAQTNAALSTTVASNTITMTSLVGPEAISITGGTYSINGGAPTNAAGFVNNGDTVVVQVVSSPSYATVVTATLTIGGVGQAFSVTTMAAPLVITGPNSGVPGAPAISATLNPGAGQPATCGFAPGAQFIPLEGAVDSPPTGSAPHGLTFPYGLFDFSIVGCNPASTVTITLTYPGPIPFNTAYWKYGPTASNHTAHWYTFPATFTGNTATITLVDGGLGDDDLTANGTIDDQGGPAFGSGSSIPSTSPWALLMLSLVVGWLGFRATRRERS